MSSRPALPGLIAGVFFLVWAAIFLTWAPVDTLRLVTGIIFVPIGLALIIKYFTGRRPAKSEHSEGGMFGWEVTRVLFSIGTMAILTGILRIVLDQSQAFPWALIAFAGIGLVALSTRGPWDSETSGRNRSVLGFRARPHQKGTLHQSTEQGK
ncbi:hypothetical protein [Pseudarthrobacter sp. PvP090]|uniref:hypothetical protein n=1 Tax=Pseudarthrobacter sp. PvP090 TaxID=3156393 RepID=UPI003395CEE7